MNKLMKSEWGDRISHWVRTLKDDFYQPLGEIQWEAFRTNEQLSLGEAKKEQFVSVKPYHLQTVLPHHLASNSSQYVCHQLPHLAECVPSSNNIHMYFPK